MIPRESMDMIGQAMYITGTWILQMINIKYNIIGQISFVGPLLELGGMLFLVSGVSYVLYIFHSWSCICLFMIKCFIIDLKNHQI